MILNQLFPMTLGQDNYGFDFSKLTKNIKTDIEETDTEYKVEMDLPGFKKDEINIKIDGDMLIVSASKESVSEEKEKKKYICKERTVSEFSRALSLGSAIDTQNISASMDNGVLKIQLPKKEKSEDTIIEIK